MPLVNPGTIRKVLENLPNVRLELALELGAVGGKGGGGGRSNSVHPPLPIRLDVDAVTREIDNTLNDLVGIIRDQVDDNGPAGPRFFSKVVYVQFWYEKVDIEYELERLFMAYLKACRILDYPSGIMD
jgi:hypothetical protein